MQLQLSINFVLYRKFCVMEEIKSNIFVNPLPNPNKQMEEEEKRSYLDHAPGLFAGFFSSLHLNL